MTSETTFGQRLRDLRKAKGLTQRELAERVAVALQEDDRRGFDFTYLSKIENDRLPPPSTAAILQLAKELDTNSDELLALAGKAPPDIGEALKHSQTARLFYRSAVNLRLSENDWKALLEELKRIEELKRRKGK
jgi:transcriptional regulator with XRE-family HTH domain